MTNYWKNLARKAMKKSAEIRAKYRLGSTAPICVYDLCQKENLKVQFIPVSMEGLYIREDKTILIGSMRPLPRRNFTCGHELGHHMFGHGSKLHHILDSDKNNKRITDPDEFLVNTFSGFLLMPTMAIRNSFYLRGWDFNSPTPEQIYVVACALGVGYETLIKHMVYTAEIITQSLGNRLLKTKVKKIKKSLLGFEENTPLVIADQFYSSPKIDIEAGTLLLVPDNIETESDFLEQYSEVKTGRVFIAKRPGIADVSSTNSDWSKTVRVSRKEYAGLLKFRFEEEIDDDN